MGIHKHFTSPRGVKYHIWNSETNHWMLWMWSNRQSGWGWKGSFESYQAAYDNMVEGDPDYYQGVEPVEE